jgi:hypothetical protein
MVGVSVLFEKTIVLKIQIQTFHSKHAADKKKNAITTLLQGTQNFASG